MSAPWSVPAMKCRICHEPLKPGPTPLEPLHYHGDRHCGTGDGSVAIVSAECDCFPHGPDEPCTCDGCWACVGHVTGCTCDIAWDCEHRQ